MNMTTIMPPKTVVCLDVISRDVLCCLKRQPEGPGSARGAR